MDWGLFHVEPAYFGIWQQYGRALKQRNAALRGPRAGGVGLDEWDRLTAAGGEQIAEMRRRYVEELARRVTRAASKIVGLSEIGLSYRRGWSEGKGLLEALREGREKDLEAGYTGRGAHRGELAVTVGGRPGREILSRGQQKTLVMALKLAQVELLAERTGKRGIVLMDDLAAELDAARRHLVVDWLRRLGVQAFVTVIDEAEWRAAAQGEERMFHVEHGQVRRVV